MTIPPPHGLAGLVSGQGYDGGTDYRENRFGFRMLRDLRTRDSVRGYDIRGQPEDLLAEGPLTPPGPNANMVSARKLCR